MPRVHLARQPIFDRRLVVVGYELLFRSSPTATEAVGPAELATTSVVLASFTELGLARVVGSAFAWINVSREFLLSGLVRTLPAARVGLEILENQYVDRELVEMVAGLRAEGYRFSLDDFRLDDEADTLLDHVDVVKLDLRALGRDGFRDHVERLRSRGVVLLAEKVETREEHAFVHALGCERFQGFFYRRPELLSGRRIDAERVALLRLLAELQREPLELQEITEMISHDVGLSLRLLRFINSAYLGLPHEVPSVGRAVRLLGPDALRRWATMSVLAGLAGVSSELTRTALVRARFCELAQDGADPAKQFTLGLFSVIDALTGTPMPVALRPLPFPKEMRDALADHSGALGRLLAAVVALEEGAFDLAEELCPDATETYLDALRWADDTAAALDGEPRPVAV